MIPVYYKSEALVTAFHSSSNIMTDPSPEESPTRYMLPDQVVGKGLLDYSLNDHSPARYPIVTKKRQNSDPKMKKKTKKLKKEPGKSVQFRPTVTENHLSNIEKSNRRERLSQRRRLPFEGHRLCIETKKSKGNLEISTPVPTSHAETSVDAKTRTRYEEKMVTNLLLLLLLHRPS